MHLRKFSNVRLAEWIAAMWEPALSPVQPSGARRHNPLSFVCLRVPRGSEFERHQRRLRSSRLPRPAASTCTCSPAIIRSRRATSFADHRSARPLVEGTVARGHLHDDTYFYTGKIGNNPGDVMPFPVTKEVLERGRERFNIYCAPCHSRIGDGNGFIPSRGFSRMPPSYHIQRLQKAPLGYFFDVMTERLRHHARLRLADFA